MSEKDLTSRMDALEQDMAQMRDEWTVVQQTPLIQGRLLSALRETQLEHSRTLVEHSRTLEEHSRTLEEHSRKLEEHDRRFDQVDAKLELLGQGMAQITGMLTTLIERDDPH